MPPIEGLEDFKAIQVEMKIVWHPPSKMKSPHRWGFSFNIDAIIATSIGWLIAKAKHAYTKIMLDVFVEKAQFL